MNRPTKNIMLYDNSVEIKTKQKGLKVSILTEFYFIQQTKTKEQNL